MKLFSFVSSLALALSLFFGGFVRAEDISEADFETVAKSRHIEGCSHCMKDVLDGMHTHMSQRQIARVVDDIMTKSGKAPDLGESETSR